MHLTVRYIGSAAAILGETYIYAGETRVVTHAQLAAAEAHHPGCFVVEDPNAPSAPAAPAAPPSPTAADVPAEPSRAQAAHRRDRRR